MDKLPLLLERELFTKNIIKNCYNCFINQWCETNKQFIIQITSI